MPEKDIAYYVNKIVELQRKDEQSSDKRYALFPILDEKAYEFYQKQEITHWTETEMEFIKDVSHYNNASDQIKRIIDIILAFFLSGDGAISENITFRFILECKSYEEKAMFISQLHIELIHAATYGLAALTFKRNTETLAELIATAENTSCIKKKIAFMEKWMLSDKPRYQRLVAFAVAEGIFFCTLFAVIFWFRSKGMFPNFIFSNELIAADESLHRDWGAFLAVREISNLLSNDEKLKQEDFQDDILEIITEGIAIEDEFADYILDQPLEDLNKEDLKKYARLIADNLLCQLSYSSYYKVKNPFTWLDDISMEQKGNFYEVRIGAYKKKSLTDVLNWKKRAGLTDENKVNAYVNPEDVDF